MQTFKELRIVGSKEALEKFVKGVLNFSKSSLWKIGLMDAEISGRYIEFEYVGEKLNKAAAYIYLGGYTGEISVGNIVPRLKSELSYDEYNDLLQCLYDEILKFYDGKDGLKVKIYGGELKIDHELSIKSYSKLRVFVIGANPSTGSAHPNDKERWMDFIVQTFVDGCVMNSEHLVRYLVEGKKWSKNIAMDLATEYENDIEILKFYVEKHGTPNG